MMHFAITTYNPDFVYKDSNFDWTDIRIAIIHITFTLIRPHVQRDIVHKNQVLF